MDIARHWIRIIPVSIACFSYDGVDALAGGFGKANRKTNGKKYKLDQSFETQALVRHLIEIEECEGVESIDIGIDAETQLRGLYAKDAFSKGEYICAIPFLSTVNLDETFFPSTESTDEMQLSTARLKNAQEFMELVGESEKPFESVYRDFLPMSTTDSNFTPTPDFWKEDDIRELQVPEIIEQLTKRKQQVQCVVEGIEGGTDIENELMQALWLVRSRAFTTLKKAITLEGTEGLLQRTVLVPFIDLLNHKKNANSKMEVVESKEYDESFYALVAKRNIKKGEELTICYGTGEEPSWELYMKYGFWPSGHFENDIASISDFANLRRTWTTTMEQDLAELAALPKSDDYHIRKEILDFRIRLKKAFEQAGGS